MKIRDTNKKITIISKKVLTRVELTDIIPSLTVESRRMLYFKAFCGFLIARLCSYM